MAYDEDPANRIRELIAGDPDVTDVTDIDPGKRSAPPHSHADEDEAFLVLAGSGLSYQTSGSEDVRTYPIGVDDLLPAADQAVLARPRWSPADTRPPFATDAELGALPLPEPTDERPPTIRNLAELPLGRFVHA